MQYFGFDRPSFGIKTYGFGSSEFSPLDLFAGGKQGVWYDPSDLSTMFLSETGRVPVTKDGDPVGLILDKSQGLEGAVTNVAKPFVADNSNAYLEVTNTLDGTKIVIKQLSTATQFNVFEEGKTYKLSVVYSIPESSDDIPAYNATGGVSRFLFTATKGVRNKAEVTLTASSTALYFRANVGEITIHEVVLKEIKGNHASQPLAASRPIYKTDGNLHWLEFDGVDDQLSYNRIIYASDNFMGAVASEAKSNGSGQFAIGDSVLPVKVGRLNDVDTFIRVQDGATGINPKIWQGVDVLSFGRYDNTMYAGVGKTRKTLNSTPTRAWFSLLGVTNLETHRLDGKVFTFALSSGYSADKEQNLLGYSSMKAGLPL